MRHTRPAALDVLRAETLIGDFMVAANRAGSLEQHRDSRFDFAEDQEPPGLLALSQDGIYQVTQGPPVQVTTDVQPWGFRFYVFQVDPAVTMVRFSISASPPALAQAVLFKDGDSDVIRSERIPFERSVAIEHAGWPVRLGMVSLGNQTTRFEITAAATAPAPDLVISRADCLPGCDSERDPAALEWDGVSPDIHIGSPGQLEFDVIENGNVASVFVRVHNKGLADANATVRLFAQRTTSIDGRDTIDDAAWVPMRDKAQGDPLGCDQAVALAVPQGASGTATATWYIDEDSRPIPPKGKGHSRGSWFVKAVWRYALRAVVDCATDGSPDNNTAIQFVSIAARKRVHKRRPPKHTKPKRPKHPKWKPKRRERRKRMS
jgi:hypothetical protein